MNHPYKVFIMKNNTKNLEFLPNLASNPICRKNRRSSSLENKKSLKAILNSRGKKEENSHQVIQNQRGLSETHKVKLVNDLHQFSKTLYYV